MTVLVISFLVQYFFKLLFRVSILEFDVGKLDENHDGASVTLGEVLVWDGHPLYFGLCEFRYRIFQCFFGRGLAQHLLVSCFWIEFR